MKISELIYALERIQSEHGDLEVERTFLTCGRMPINRPELAHRAKLKGRESTPRFAEWYSHEENYESERKGEAVCRL
jgi:hypothetical protein